MATKKQKIQRQRAWFLRVVSGLFKPISPDILTSRETQLWIEILNRRAELMYIFEESSREFGLKVPKHRCWCNKEGKYSKDVNNKEMWFCKKHYCEDN